jgi:hypothetical protein
MQVSSIGQSQSALLAPSQTAQAKGATAPEESVDKSATAKSDGDTVKLSLPARVRLLKRQGENISQIASQLGLDVKTVSSYINGQGLTAHKAYTPSSGTPPQAPPSPDTPEPAPSSSGTPDLK